MTLYELLQLLRAHVRMLVVFTLVAALGTGMYSLLFMRDTYTVSTSMYVLADQSTDNATSSSLQSTLSSSQMITTDVSDLLKSGRVNKQVAKTLGLDSLDEFDISVESETGSRVISISVTGTDPELVTSCANDLAQSTADIAQEVMGVKSVNIIDEAERPEAPSGPRRTLYVAVAAMAGFMVATAIIVLLDMLNTKVRSEEMLEQITELPIMGRVPQVHEGSVING